MTEIRLGVGKVNPTGVQQRHLVFARTRCLLFAYANNRPSGGFEWAIPGKRPRGVAVDWL